MRTQRFCCCFLTCLLYTSSTETFEAAQEIRKKRGRSQKIPTGECYSLARKVFCGECGNTMWKNTCIVRGEKHSYLACRTRKTSNTGCDNKHQIDLNALEDVILSKLNELLALYYNKKIIGKISAERHVGYNDTSVLSELKAVSYTHLFNHFHIT